MLAQTLQITEGLYPSGNLAPTIKDVIGILGQVGPWVLGLIFQAGILYAVIIAMRRDLNGVGAKVRSIQEAAEQRYLTTVIAILIEGVAKENREVYLVKAKMFVESARGRNL